MTKFVTQKSTFEKVCYMKEMKCKFEFKFSILLNSKIKLKRIENVQMEFLNGFNFILSLD